GRATPRGAQPRQPERRHQAASGAGRRRRRGRRHRRVGETIWTASTTSTSAVTSIAATALGQYESRSTPNPWAVTSPWAPWSSTAERTPQVPPKPVSVPQITSSWARNGLKYRSASGGRRVSEASGEPSRTAGCWSGRKPELAVIAVQNTNTNVAPAVSVIVRTRLITVAAW